MTWRVEHGDCLDVMRGMADASVDAVVSDPPYGLSFMGKAWDHGVPGVPFWVEALRVAKPGAHLLAFGGTRTFHRLAVAIEDAGWEIRDDVLRLMSQDEGFRALWGTLNEAQQHALAEVLNQHGMGGCLAWNYGTGFPKSHNLDGAWDGWGTALKPAWEPIIVARKPLVGTVARNVGEFGTGALNIDASRVPTDGGKARIGEASQERRYDTRGGTNFAALPGPRGGDPSGRWPANVILDETSAALLDAATGNLKAGVAVQRNGGGQRIGSDRTYGGHDGGLVRPDVGFNDSGGASRFFYVAKASRSERWEYLTCDCEAGILPAWVNEVRSRREPTGVTSPPRATCAEHSTGDCECSTSSSGSEHTVPSPTDTRSTTSTRTSKTTESRTFDLFPPPSTSASTAGACLSTADGSSPAESAANESPLTPSTSTCLPKVGPSTGVAAPAISARSWKRSACGSCGAPIRSEGHATVKPVDVMRWLCRLVTPPNGIVLDPFTGSGTTGVAAMREGFRFVGIEREAQYVEIARARIAAAETQPALPGVAA